MTSTILPSWARHITPTRYHQLCEVARKFNSDQHGVALLAGAIPSAREYVPKRDDKRIKQSDHSEAAMSLSWLY